MRRATRGQPGPPLRLRIDSLDSQGRGVSRNPEGKVVFVEGALGGEIVQAVLVKRDTAYDLMRTVEVVSQSSARRAPPCPNFGLCGGCATQHAQSHTQVAAKQRWLEDSLSRIGKVVPEVMLAPILGEEWGYRHRARLTARRVAKKGGVLVGFHERHSSYVADMRECHVLPQRVSDLIPELRALIEKLSVRARLPQIELAVGEDRTVLVFRNLDPLSAEDDTLMHAFAAQYGVDVWLQPGGPDTAYGIGSGAAALPDYTLPEFDVRIAFRPTDFTQVNHGVNRVLVSRAVRLLEPGPGEHIGDLFCGLGNFSLPIARSGAQVTGFETSAALLERARGNASENGLTVRFEAINLFEPGFERHGPFDKLLIDPPRDGAMEVVKSLPDAWPRRIVYVSCDPATLARDAGVLVNTRGFRLEAAGVVNMFPHTAHVESIALFTRGK